MTKLFILGAGASRSSGAPLMTEFLERARTLHRAPPAGINLDHDAFEDVFRATSELQGVYAKSHLDLDNIESFFGIVEMAQLLGKLGPRDQSGITGLRVSLLKLIVQTLEYNMPFRILDGDAVPSASYKTLVESFQDFQNQSRERRLHSIAAMTFNYDLGLDVALSKEGMRFDYGLDEDQKEMASSI